jgi:hypothetical protein
MPSAVNPSLHIQPFVQTHPYRPDSPNRSLKTLHAGVTRNPPKVVLLHTNTKKLSDTQNGQFRCTILQSRLTQLSLLIPEL